MAEIASLFHLVKHSALHNLGLFAYFILSVFAARPRRYGISISNQVGHWCTTSLMAKKDQFEEWEGVPIPYFGCGAETSPNGVTSPGYMRCIPVT